MVVALPKDMQLNVARTSLLTAWVSRPETTPQIMFIRRTSRPSDRYSSHIAFPGGRSEPSDTSSHYTALRETWEEIGVDLAEKEYGFVGRLDDREITTSLGKRLLMILSPFGESSYAASVASLERRFKTSEHAG